VAAVEACDNFTPLRNGLRRIAAARGDWAGIPMPLEGERLVVEPTYPNAQALMEMCGPAANEDDRDPQMVGAKLRNSFYSAKKRCEVLVIEKADGSITFGLEPAIHHLVQDLQTLGCSDAWGIEQESMAVQLLGTLLGHRAFKQYLLTGAFIESSKRSGVFYLFRRLKPTVAISTRTGKPKVLCALCLHRLRTTRARGPAPCARPTTLWRT
jgi:hypothetical protein